MDKQNGNKNGSNPDYSNKLNSSNDIDTNCFYRRGRYDNDDDDSVDISYKVIVSGIIFYLFIHLSIYLSKLLII